jgi:hypothetical protein
MVFSGSLTLILISYYRLSYSKVVIRIGELKAFRTVDDGISIFSMDAILASADFIHQVASAFLSSTLPLFWFCLSPLQ